LIWCWLPDVGDGERNPDRGSGGNPISRIKLDDSVGEARPERALTHSRLYFSVWMKHLRIPAAGEAHGAREDIVDRVYFSLNARVPFGMRFQTARGSLIHDTDEALLSWCLNVSCWSLPPVF